MSAALRALAESWRTAAEQMAANAESTDSEVDAELATAYAECAERLHALLADVAPPPAPVLCPSCGTGALGATFQTLVTLPTGDPVEIESDSFVSAACDSAACDYRFVDQGSGRIYRAVLHLTASSSTTSCSRASGPRP